MVREIDELRRANESLGGVFEVQAFGLVPGLGSHVSWEERLDGRLAMAVCSIQAVKGVAIGDAFAVAGVPGSQAHDEILFSEERGYYRETNRAGGLEGGMTNGSPLIVRGAMKPLSTLTKPLRSVDIFIVLEPRDIPFLWWLYHARGRRDLLIIRAQVGAPPRFELEALDLRAWSTRGIERSVRRHQWTPVAVPPGSPLVAYSRGPSDAAAEVLHIATLPELSLVRVAVHRGAPNLEVQWTLAGLDRLESARLLETVRRLAQRL